MSKRKRKNIRTLTIDRKTWIRGNINLGVYDGSRLLSEEGNMCCLGFLGKRCGIGTAELSDALTPGECQSNRLFPEWAIESKRAFNDSYACGLLMRINDDPTLKWNTREARLRNAFAEHGIKVTFK